MLLNHQLLRLGTGLLFVLASTSVRAADPPETPAGTSERINELTNSIAELERGFADLKKSLDSLTQQISDFRTNDVQLQDNTRKINELSQSIQNLRTDLDRLRSPATESRISQYQGTPPATPNYYIRLTNRWMAPMSVVVDGIPHELRPGEAKLLTTTNPTFNYEVLNVQPVRSRTFSRAGQTFEITIHPPA